MIGALAARWPLPLRLIHWLTATLVVLTIPAAYLAQALTETATDAAEALVGLHILIGLSILVLTLARLALRLVLPAPCRDGESAAIRLARGLPSALFYALLVALPATGILKLTLSGLDVSAFGVTLIPAGEMLPGEMLPNVARRLNRAHEWLGKSLIALALLHAGAGLARFRRTVGAPEHPAVMGVPVTPIHANTAPADKARRAGQPARQGVDGRDEPVHDGKGRRPRSFRTGFMRRRADRR